MFRDFEGPGLKYWCQRCLWKKYIDESLWKCRKCETGAMWMPPVILNLTDQDIFCKDTVDIAFRLSETPVV